MPGSGELRCDVLPNGLRVITERIPRSRTFSLGVFVPVGSRHEPRRLRGASHFLEHVLFKGTTRRTAEEISGTVEAVGGDINAYTAKEHTCFYARMLDSHADVAVEVLTDLIGSPLIRAADIRSERAVILDEIAMHADDPAEVAGDLVASAVFGAGGLGAPVIGTANSVRGLSRSAVAKHWARHYRPSHLVVAATGQVEHERLLERLASLPERPSPSPRPVVQPSRPAAKGELVTSTLGVEQVTAVLGFPGVGVFDPRRYALGLLSLVVGGGMASRLFVEIRERRGLTYGIDAGETTYTDTGLWTVDWQCAPERLLEITAAVRQILLDVAEDGVTAEELARAKGQIRGQTVLADEGPVSRMCRLGGNALIGDDRTINDLLDSYDAVTGAEVAQLAAEMLSQAPVLALVGPRVPTRRLRRLLTHW